MLLISRHFRVLLLTFCFSVTLVSAQINAVINTWPWTQATDAAYAVLSSPPSSSSSSSSSSLTVSAVVSGCGACQLLQCDGTVGFGGSPDESGETTLDALIMNGDTFQAGAVADLRRIKDAIGLARYVMEFTTHTMLAGDQATAFAIQNGFPEENLTTPASAQMHSSWIANKCQPNYRQNVIPDATTSCGPYQPAYNPLPSFSSSSSSSSPPPLSPDVVDPRGRPPLSPSSHDTIAMIALDVHGSMSAGTSTNGARNKIAGRVGDGPIIGSGAYVDSAIGGCGETGDGDIMMRFVPSFSAVSFMGQGLSPTDAANAAITKIAKFYPNFQGSIVCLNNKGEHGAAAHGWQFSYSVRTSGMNASQIINVSPQ